MTLTSPFFATARDAQTAEEYSAPRLPPHAVAVKCPICSQFFGPLCCFCKGEDITEAAAWHHCS